MVASSIPCKLSLCADRVQARAGDSYVLSAIDVACPTSQSVFAIASPHELQGDSWPSSSTGTSSFCCNHQYSITAVTTSTGSIAECYAYSAYGQPTILDASASVLSSSAINNRYTYTGREWDATLALHHFRARWINALTGRFTSRDPIGYVDGQNLFEFLAATPLNELDPSGNLIASPGTLRPQRPRHLPGVKKCIFVLPSGRETQCLKAWAKEMCVRSGANNCEVIDPTLSDIDVLNAVHRFGCCEIVMMGHQGGEKNPGGCVIKTGFPNDPKTYDDESQVPLFPSSDGNFERQLAIEFNKNGCKNCNIVQYACGHTPAAQRDPVRRRIASLTGCSFWGTTELCKVDDIDTKKDVCNPCKRDGEPRYPNQKDCGKYRQPKMQVYDPIITTR